MSGAALMGHQFSATPRQDEMEYDFPHLARHNANTFSQDPIYGPDGGMYLPSSQTDAALPEGPYNAHLFNNNELSRFQGQDDLGIGYETYGTPTSTQYESRESPGPNCSSVANRSTREGRNLKYAMTAALGKTGTSKTPRTKAARRKTQTTKTPRIDNPLSELTKGLVDVPIRDMEEWVNRSDEIRYREVEKRNGNVARPMNSFMLYRSAYAERTKVWCAQNNHQVVSTVSGESWPMEPPEVRERYNDLANIERANHAKAHPHYKFSPSKGNQVARKKNVVSSDEGSDQSDVGDADSEWKPRGVRGGNLRSKKRKHRADSHELSESPLWAQYDSYFGSSYGSNRSWEALNETKPYPAGFMVPLNPYGHYYPTPMYPVLQSHGMENMGMHSTVLPEPQYAYMHNEMSASYNPDILQLHSRQDTPESHIDPMLTHLHESSVSQDEETNLFGDHHDQTPQISQFEEWMAEEERM